MAIEIERKYLVKGDAWRSLGIGEIYRQGYLATKEGVTVRVRVVGDRGYLTIKGKTVGIARSEFEYPIPVEDAQIMLDTLCDRPLIEKIRYKILVGDLTWEVDEFLGENVKVIGQKAGLHLLLEFYHLDTRKLVQQAEKLGIRVYLTQQYWHQTAPISNQPIIIGYGGVSE